MEVSIREGDRCFLFTSDVQGAGLPEHVAFIRSENPDMLYLDGPLTYMMGQTFSQDDLRASLKNIGGLLETTRLRTILMDHHLTRDPGWNDAIREVRASAEKNGKRLVTAAGFLGKADEMLEAHRRQLFAWNPDMPETAMERSRNFQLVKELGKK